MSVKRQDLLQGTQLPMFSQGEDLPLFSGTAPRAKPVPFKQKDTARQTTLAACPICLDTGRVDGAYCTCDAGLQARKRDRIEEEGAAACEAAFGGIY